MPSRLVGVQKSIFVYLNVTGQAVETGEEICQSGME